MYCNTNPVTCCVAVFVVEQRFLLAGLHCAGLSCVDDATTRTGKSSKECSVGWNIFFFLEWKNWWWPHSPVILCPRRRMLG